MCEPINSKLNRIERNQEKKKYKIGIEPIQTLVNRIKQILKIIGDINP